MLTGSVRWFNDAKGHGLITPDDGGNDLFIHYSQINRPGLKTLKEGEKVSYEVHRGPKGNMAVNVYPDGVREPTELTDAQVDAAGSANERDYRDGYRDGYRAGYRDGKGKG